MNWYLITNIASGLGIIAFFVGSMAIEKFAIKKIKTVQITIVAMLTGVSVVLTNLLSYNLPILPGGIKLALGEWIIFLTGMMFGPMLGTISGICTDALGSIINVGGVYHSGFMLDKVILGFAGGLVFLFKQDKFVVLKTIGIYLIAYAFETLLLNPIWLYASGWSDAVFVSMIIKTIKYPIASTIYLSLIFSTFGLMKLLLNRMSFGDDSFIWFKRHSMNSNVSTHNLVKEN